VVLELVVEKVLMEEIVLSSLSILRRVMVPSISWFLQVDRMPRTV
jgi:hypothetical protein